MPLSVEVLKCGNRVRNVRIQHSALQYELRTGFEHECLATVDAPGGGEPLRKTEGSSKLTLVVDPFAAVPIGPGQSEPLLRRGGLVSIEYLDIP